MEAILVIVYKYLDILFKIVLCSFLTGLIGYNREKNGMTIGIRTHILVGLSAVLVQVMCISFLSELGGNEEHILRVVGSFCQSIGFLGAGAIMKGSKHIKGLTTAASIFFVACIGLAIGLGVYGPTILITIVAYLFLTDSFGLKKLVSIKKSTQITLSVEVSGLYNEHANEITSVLDDIGVDVDYIEATAISMEKSKVMIKVNMNDETNINEVLSELINIKSVLKTEVVKKSDIKVV